MHKNNDPADLYHLPLYDYVVIGHELVAERDIVRINFSSQWMLANALRAIAAGWGFQINGDVTGNFCRASVDLVGFGVNSIPCQNNVLCLSLIPKATESERVYQITYGDLRKAATLLCSVKACSEDCESCSKLTQLIRDDNVVK